METENDKITIMIDASSLKHISCFRKFFWMVVKGYKNKEFGSGSKYEYAMAYGSAIHKFLENFYGCKPVDECVNAAIEFYRPYSDSVPFSDREFRYNTNLIKTCAAYSEQFKRIKDRTDGGADNEENIIIHHDDFQPLLNTEDKKTIEYKFSIIIYENAKYRLILTGTVDLVCSYRNIELLLVDHKSTATSADKSDGFFSEYVLDIQTMLYSKVYKEQLKLDYYPPVLINGIFIKKPTQKAEKLGIFDGVEIKRSPPISYSEEQMEQFNMWFNERVAEIKLYLVNNFDNVERIFNLSQCKIGGQTCQYFDVCKLPLKFHQGVLDARFEQKQYNPLKFR